MPQDPPTTGFKKGDVPAIPQITVLWMTAGLGCDGDTIAVTSATQPSIEDLVLGAFPWIPKVKFHSPFLGKEKQETFDIVAEVAASIRMKAQEDAVLRAQVARDESENIAGAVVAIREHLDRDGKLIIFGNGGSATDANDLAIDCVMPPVGFQPIPAVSLSMEPANISAIANDVGTELIFQRQLIAQARPNDIAVAIFTSGGSKSIVAAIEEARKRNLLTVALLGYDGGEVLRRDLADFPIIVRSDYISRIQEVQASIYHLMCELLQGPAHA